MVSLKDFLSKILIIHALIALSIADVSHLRSAYLPPYHSKPLHVAPSQELAAPPQPQVQHDEVPQAQLDVILLDESANGNSHALKDVDQSLDNEPVAIVHQSSTDDNAASESASDPFFQPSFGGFPGGGIAPNFGGPTYPGQGFTGAGFPGQGFAGQGFPATGFAGQGFAGQGFPGQALSGAGFAGQGFPGQGFPGQGLPASGFAGQGFPGQGFSGAAFPGQGFSGQGFPGQGFSGAGFPGQGFSGQGFPGQGFPVAGFPGAGFPGQGFPPQAGGFPGLPYQTQQQSGGDFNTPQPIEGLNTRVHTTRIASDTVYGANGGYVYDKPK
ncbi:RNA-binding protein 12 [Bactrocera tryoni]|uniref:RNA-binding protein 12 n=1 Tax=Bactrocera tryoni TaxID=59916 RepID=UPI001A9A126F|nr:RNA-binding protein 12 [Bactrocera tryoni]